MRYIDRTNCTTAFEPGNSTEIQTLGALTREATKIAESKRLAVLKTRWGAYKIIRACGLGYIMECFATLADVDKALKSL